MSWAAILVLAVGTYACKAVGPLLLADRTLPPRLEAVAALLPPALLAALVVVQTFEGGSADGGVVLDARAAALVVAGVALWLRAPFVFVVVLATVTAAGLRLLGLP